MLALGNEHLILVYVRRRINEIYTIQENNDQVLIKENIDFLKAIKDGQGEVPADLLNYER
jgi:hypothetical protein